MTTGKTIGLTIWTFVGKTMSSALGGWNGSIEWCKASNPSGTFLDTSKMNSASQLFFRFTSDKANETQDCEWYIQGVLA